MATKILAGNATNGLVLTPDNTGILEIKTGTGAGTTALTLNASQNATVAGTLTVGSTLQVAGVTTNLYPLVSGTSKTAITDFTTTAEFTGIPAYAKRVTLMWSGLSLSGTDSFLVQIGDTSGGFATTLYNGGGTRFGGGTLAAVGFTSGFGFNNVTAAQLFSGFITIVNVTGNIWSAMGMQGTDATENNSITAGTRTLTGVLDRVRMTRTGTNTFDAGTINIMWE